jgi:hypothetical protein
MARTEVVRLKLTISQELSDLLETRANESSCSRADVLRKGLMLYELAIESKRRGECLGVFSADGKLLQEIIGIG